MDARIKLTVWDSSSGTRVSLTPAQWTATVQGGKHYIVRDRDLKQSDGRYLIGKVASGKYSVDWEGNVSTANNVSSLTVGIDDLVLDEHPGMVFKWSQLAPFNNRDAATPISGDWTDDNTSSVIVVDLEIDLPPLED